ncbi:MAG TPA: DNA-primase RepB domain-containing protein [Terriglobales bacterium]
MPTLEEKPDGQHALTPEEYIRENFESADRLAVVVINRKEGKVLQRVETAETIASPKYQAWLRHQNAHGSDIYIAQNSLRETATGRTKAEIADIRHVYLDLDNDGAKALAAIEHSSQVPKPSYVISSSPGKYQVIWKVKGISQEQAEALQRKMVQQFGADPAATDSARVLRLPGFFNKKYEQPFRVSAEAKSFVTYQPGDFKLSHDQSLAVLRESPAPRVQTASGRGPRSASEHDWNWAARRLDRGESIEALIQKLTDYRDDKPNPGYYARRTVTRAYAHVALSRGEDPQAVIRAISEHPPRPYDNGEQYARTVVEETLAKLGRSKRQEVATTAQAYQHTQQLALGVSR